MSPLRFVLPLCCALLSPVASGDAFDVPADRVDRILIVKSERKMYLQSAGRTLRTFDVSLGLVPEGAKQREGDFRTPEGVYYVESKNAGSDFFLALKVSYPNEQDRARARVKGIDPGGQIMIHGLPNVPKYPESRYLGTDWTDGCIAVSNSDMVDLWLMTSVATPIEIRP
ncbi:MAG TPA: L,D-transpeptidase family protein [Gammaproteobacteria bacterium]|jgi:murein L,D-transpeptidase YafK